MFLRNVSNAGHFFLPHRLPAALNSGRVPVRVVVEKVEL